MTNQAPSPFDPIAIGPLRLRNRLIKSATNEGRAKGGIVSEGLADFHEDVAAGGAALTTVAYCATSQDGRTFVDQAVLDDGSLADFRALTDRVHRHGAAASAQITHAGCFTFLPRDVLHTSRPLSASGGFNKVGVMSNRWLKKAMNRAEMEAITAEFVAAALTAREAGFDAVELHMGHGYLLSQFISRLYNKRRDAFGGSIEKRVRFPGEVLARVLDAVGKDLAVIVKYSMTDGVPHGNRIEDGVAVARAIEAKGAHLAVLSNGMNVESITAMFGSPFPKSNRAAAANPVVKLGMWIQSLTEPKDVTFRENYLLDHARAVRAAVTIPLAYLGGMDSRAGIEALLSEGFDCVAAGRAFLYEPDLAKRMEADPAWRSGCNRCNLCVSMMYAPTGTYCALKPPPNAKANYRHAAEALAA